MISLFELRIDDDFFAVNSNDLAIKLNLSQQAISTHLIEFEKNGLPKIYNEKKFYEAYSNKRYRYNYRPTNYGVH